MFPQALLGVIPELKARSNPWALPDMTPKEQQQKRIRIKFRKKKTKRLVSNAWFEVLRETMAITASGSCIDWFNLFEHLLNGRWRMEASENNKAELDPREILTLFWHQSPALFPTWQKPIKHQSNEMIFWYKDSGFSWLVEASVRNKKCWIWSIMVIYRIRFFHPHGNARPVPLEEQLSTALAAAQMSSCSSPLILHCSLHMCESPKSSSGPLSPNSFPIYSAPQCTEVTDFIHNIFSPPVHMAVSSKG